MPHETLRRVSDDTIGYRELADRIEVALGHRPALATLRAASSTTRRTPGVRPRPRITVGMPAPLPAEHRTTPARFRVDDVDAWLHDHPLRAANRHTAEFRERIAAGVDEGQAVALARADGLTWRQITAELISLDGKPRSVAGVHKRHRAGARATNE